MRTDSYAGRPPRRRRNTGLPPPPGRHRPTGPPATSGWTTTAAAPSRRRVPAADPNAPGRASAPTRKNWETRMRHARLGRHRPAIVAAATALLVGVALAGTQLASAA